MYETRKRPRPARPGLILLLCVIGGAYFGCLPMATSYVVRLEGGSLYLIYKVSFPENFIASCIVGGIVGLLCSPFAVIALSGRRRGPALGLVVGLTSLVVVALTLALGLGTAIADGMITLMVLSALSFCGVCALAASLVPKVTTDPGKCQGCGYDLRGSLESGRCPECGRSFDPAIVVANRPDDDASP